MEQLLIRLKRFMGLEKRLRRCESSLRVSVWRYCCLITEQLFSARSGCICGALWLSRRLAIFLGRHHTWLASQAGLLVVQQPMCILLLCMVLCCMVLLSVQATTGLLIMYSCKIELSSSIRGTSQCHNKVKTLLLWYIGSKRTFTLLCFVASDNDHVGATIQAQHYYILIYFCF